MHLYFCLLTYIFFLFPEFCQFKFSFLLLYPFSSLGSFIYFLQLFSCCHLYWHSLRDLLISSILLIVLSSNPLRDLLFSSWVTIMTFISLFLMLLSCDSDVLKYSGLNIVGCLCSGDKILPWLLFIMFLHWILINCILSDCRSRYQFLGLCLWDWWFVLWFLFPFWSFDWCALWLSRVSPYKWRLNFWWCV